VKHPWFKPSPWLSAEEAALVAVQSLLAVNISNDRHVVKRGDWYGVEL
jgi:hypothetical protein